MLGWIPITVTEALLLYFLEVHLNIRKAVPEALHITMKLVGSKGF
jgi:hypothetical protein